MLAKECGLMARGVMLSTLALAVAAGMPSPALAQKAPRGSNGPTQVKPTPAPAPAQADQVYDPTKPGQLQLKRVAVPVNPTDPIAIINNVVITRQQLAEECVIRKGEEILETLISRSLIEQALKRKGLEITAAEVDKEIENVAQRVARLGREAWLRTLAKERGISPIQYARDIIYPALALRKLAAPMVQVTPEDVRVAFEAQYGEKLRCRMIMVDKLHTAQEIWEQLKKNPGGFEKLAMDRSMDSGSRSLGGLLAEPISRHAYPQTVSDAAFEQLVDGDKNDKDPSHKPKDGDFTGPIQVAEATWVILQRDRIIPGQQVDPNNAEVKKATFDMIYEVKLKEAMGTYMINLMRDAMIDNKLTGQIKQPNEEIDYDKQVQLSGNKVPSGPAPAPTPGAAAPKTNVKTPTPAALSPEVAAEAQKLGPASSKK